MIQNTTNDSDWLGTWCNGPRSVPHGKEVPIRACILKTDLPSGLLRPVFWMGSRFFKTIEVWPRWATFSRCSYIDGRIFCHKNESKLGEPFSSFQLKACCCFSPLFDKSYQVNTNRVTLLQTWFLVAFPS